MNDSPTRVNSWRQEGLFPAENVRITCTVDLTGGGNENVFRVEAEDLFYGSLIAVWALPLRAHDTFEQDLLVTLAEFRDLIRHHVHPF